MNLSGTPIARTGTASKSSVQRLGAPSCNRFLRQSSPVLKFTSFLALTRVYLVSSLGQFLP